MKTWQALLQLIRFRPWLFTANITLWSLRQAIFLVPGLFTREYFNQLTGDSQMSWTINTMIMLMMVVFLLSTGVISLSEYVNATFKHYSFALLRKNLLNRLLTYPGARATPYTPGETISRLGGDVNEVVMFTQRLTDGMSVAVSAIIALVFMMTIDPFLTTVVALPIMLIGLITNLAGQRIKAYRQASRAATGDVSGFIGEIFSAVQAIQAATTEAPIVQRFRRLNDIRRTAALKDRLLNESINAVNDNVANIGTGLVLLVVGQFMQSGSVTVGDFALFIYLLPTTTEFTKWIGRILTSYRQADVSLTRLFDLLAQDPPERVLEHGPVHLKGPLPEVSLPQHSPTDSLHSLRVEALSYRYPDTGGGIHNISLNLKRGDFVVITGRIGAGKSTLLRALLGLLPAQEGRIFWNNQPVLEPATFFQPPRCAYTGQIPRLFSNTLRENILLGRSDIGPQNLSQAIHTAVLDYDLQEMDHGLETMVGSRGVRLSGGQVQRTAAARMFARQAQLLVFDDLSSALDLETEKQLWTRLFAQTHAQNGQSYRPTCLVVSHRRAALRQANHIIVLKNGHIEAKGQLDDLLAHSPEMQKLWHGQENQ